MQEPRLPGGGGGYCSCYCYHGSCFTEVCMQRSVVVVIFEIIIK